MHVYEVWIIFAMVATYPIYYGFLLSKLWSWFISPTFGLPKLTKAQAAGLLLVVSIFFYNPFQSNIAQTIDKAVYYYLVVPIITLAFGTIIRMFLPVRGR